MKLLQPESLETATAALGNGSVALAGGTDLVPLLRDRLVEAETLVELRGVVPRGVHEGGSRIGAGTALAELDLHTRLVSIHNHTLVMCGALDQTTPPALAREVAAAIPGGRSSGQRVTAATRYDTLSTRTSHGTQ